MDPVSYRKATAADIPALIELRCAFLAEVNGADPNDPELSQALLSYFSSHIPTGDFVAFCGIVDDRAVAASGLVFHHHPPSSKNLAGKQAYIMNMYTVPEWRGRGIGTRLLQELLAVARATRCHRVRLNALPKAERVYTRMGFVRIDGEMELPLSAFGKIALNPFIAQQIGSDGPHNEH